MPEQHGEDGDGQFMVDEPEEVEEDAAAEAVEPACDQMRAARKAAKMSLKAVAEKTRVPLRHLEALERGDYEALPGVTYCAGFARAYARAVGMDEAELVAQLRAEIDEMGGVRHDGYEFEEAVNPRSVPPRWLAWTAAIIAILLAGGYFIWRSQLATAPTDEQIARQTRQETRIADRAGTPAAPNMAPNRAEGPVVMTAADEVWLRIYQPDGKRLFEGALQKGQSYTLPTDAKDPMILTGRPDALAITVGGVAIPPLGTAEKTISDVPISPKALLARLHDAQAAGQGETGAADNASAPMPADNAPGG